MKPMKFLVAPVLIALVALTGCSESNTVSTQPQSLNQPGLTNLSLSTIYDTAGGAGVFNTLVAAVDAAGLDGALKGTDPLTVFAPTDEAFAALPAFLVPFLLEEENEDLLTEILLYHVVAGAKESPEVLDSRNIKTLIGKKVFPRLKGGVPFVNDSEITGPDVLASNGVIHIVDSVLVPPGFLGRVNARVNGGYN